eukprot:scaffold125753_cov53-Phaeocystis_antarctica.AAC.4
MAYVAVRMCAALALVTVADRASAAPASYSWLAKAFLNPSNSPIAGACATRGRARLRVGGLKASAIPHS